MREGRKALSILPSLCFLSHFFSVTHSDTHTHARAHTHTHTHTHSHTDTHTKAIYQSLRVMQILKEHKNDFIISMSHMTIRLNKSQTALVNSIICLYSL